MKQIHKKCGNCGKFVTIILEKNTTKKLPSDFLKNDFIGQHRNEAKRTLNIFLAIILITAPAGYGIAKLVWGLYQ